MDARELVALVCMPSWDAECTTGHFAWLAPSLPQGLSLGWQPAPATPLHAGWARVRSPRGMPGSKQQQAFGGDDGQPLEEQRGGRSVLQVLNLLQVGGRARRMGIERRQWTGPRSPLLPPMVCTCWCACGFGGDKAGGGTERLFRVGQESVRCTQHARGSRARVQHPPAWLGRTSGRPWPGPTQTRQTTGGSRASSGRSHPGTCGGAQYRGDATGGGQAEVGDGWLAGGQVGGVQDHAAAMQSGGRPTPGMPRPASMPA